MDAILALQVLFPARGALDFQGLFPFVLLPYYYRTITGFSASKWEPIFCNCKLFNSEYFQ